MRPTTIAIFILSSLRLLSLYLIFRPLREETKRFSLIVLLTEWNCKLNEIFLHFIAFSVACKIQLRKLIMAVNHLTGWKIINFNFHDECRTYPGNYLRTKWRLLMQHKMGPKMMKSSFIFIKLKKLFEASKSHLKLSDLLITSHKSRIHISKVERVLQAVLSKHE